MRCNAIEYIDHFDDIKKEISFRLKWPVICAEYGFVIISILYYLSFLFDLDIQTQNSFFLSLYKMLIAPNRSFWSCFASNGKFMLIFGEIWTKREPNNFEMLNLVKPN